MILFIIKNSLWKEKQDILKYTRPKDKVLLIQDGVLILNNNKSEFLKKIREKKLELLALKEDVDLRGVKNNAKAKLIDYDSFVELIEKNKVFS